MSLEAEKIFQIAQSEIIPQGLDEFENFYQTYEDIFDLATINKIFSETCLNQEASCDLVSILEFLLLCFKKEKSRHKPLEL